MEDIKTHEVVRQKNLKLQHIIPRHNYMNWKMGRKSLKARAKNKITQNNDPGALTNTQFTQMHLNWTLLYFVFLFLLYFCFYNTEQPQKDFSSETMTDVLPAHKKQQDIFLKMHSLFYMTLQARAGVRLNAILTWLL